MASPPMPFLEHLAGRPFSFYPAILQVTHNQWHFRKATWSDLVVVNSKTGLELSIPRRFVGEVSSLDRPVFIVGLHRELEYRDGAVWPYRRRVIEMPLAVGDAGASSAATAHRSGPAQVVGIRLETPRGGRTLKLVGGAMAAAVFLSGVSLVRTSGVRQRTVAVRGRAAFNLRPGDSYPSIVRKLGPPDGERRLSQDGAEYQALPYSDLRLTVILRDARYLGTMDATWHPINPAPPASGESPLDELRSLKRF